MDTERIGRTACHDGTTTLRRDEKTMCLDTVRGHELRALIPISRTNRHQPPSPKNAYTKCHFSAWQMYLVSDSYLLPKRFANWRFPRAFMH